MQQYSNTLSHTVTVSTQIFKTHERAYFTGLYEHEYLFMFFFCKINSTVYLFCVCSMLRSNRISCVSNSSFVGLSSVRLLSLYDNQITSMNPGAFDTLHSLSTLWVHTHTLRHTHSECKCTKNTHTHRTGQYGWYLDVDYWCFHR